MERQIVETRQKRSKKAAVGREDKEKEQHATSAGGDGKKKKGKKTTSAADQPSLIDFSDGLDVKTSKPKSAPAVTADDDAWDLLNQ